MRRTRFAPSPTGYLHLGHAFSALTAAARADPGQFLLRIEDIDDSRVRPEYEAAIFEDLRWLGLFWPEPVRHQSDAHADYADALGRLAALDLCYPCACTRGDIAASLSAPQEGVAAGPDGQAYLGTCRGRPMAGRGTGDAIRLDIGRALARLGDAARLGFEETGEARAGWHQLDPAWLLHSVGDIVLARRDIGTAAYHLAVVVDDAAQGVTEAVRGADLFEATFIHRLLQALLDLPTPAYHHHPLIRDEAGRRLAKRDDARALRRYRADGLTPKDIRRMVGLD